jgi:hypothetical protein
VYGAKEADEALVKSGSYGAALYQPGTGTTAEYGTFSGADGTWVKTVDGEEDGTLSTTNDTVKVADGILQ